MALFGSGSRKVELEFIGDSKQLERTIGRVETRMQKFGKNVNSLGGAAGMGKSGLLGFATKGNAVLAGVAALGLGLRKMSQEAREAELILGQTSVAVNNAGISWTANAKRIDDAATAISRSSAFDDEDVLKSFQVFVRGQKDVGKALELSSLAADVARGRYTDLETATMLVNKAAMGQVGALRRAGIQIDANATATQALTQLQKTFAGSSAEFMKTATGSAERLKVAWGNLMETMGEGTTSPKKQVEDFLSRMLEGLDKNAQKLQEVQLGWQMLLNTPGTDRLIFPVSPGLTSRPEEGAAGQSIAAAAAKQKPRQPKLITQLSNRLIAEAQRAELSGSQSALRAVLVKEKAFLQNALGQKGLKPGQVVALQGDLLTVADSIQAIDDQIARDAQDKVDAAKRAKDAMAAAKKKAIDALKAQAQAFKDQASDIKSAVLDALDFKQAKVENTRALADAKESLRIARMIGAPGGIKEAKRAVADAQFAITRQRIEGDPYRITDGPKGPVNTLTAGSIVININGADDPETIARKVIAVINKGSRTTAGQSRGRTSGNPMHR